LVALAEEGMINTPVTIEALKHYLNDLDQEDTLLLGCTHFPVFIPQLNALLPNITLINPAEATAKELERTLLQCNLLNPAHHSTVHYLVTDSIQRFQKVGEIFLGESLQNTPVELIDAC
jgi:glutamate racemase